jgi:hypothetical protein
MEKMDMDVFKPQEPVVDQTAAVAPVVESHHESQPTAEEVADHAKLREFGTYALDDPNNAFEAIQALNEIIRQYEGGAQSNTSLDDVFIRFTNGRPVVLYTDLETLQSQVDDSGITARMQELTRNIQNTGFLSDPIGSQRRAMNDEFSRLKKQRNSAASKIAAANELVASVDQFVHLIPSVFLKGLSQDADHHLSSIVGVKSSLDEALALKRKYPNYREILGMAK